MDTKTERNRAAQVRWRERNIARRRLAQRVANMLVRQKWPAGAVEELAGLLRSFLTTHGVASLRRALKPLSREQIDALNRKREERVCDWWLREHPGRTAVEYRRFLRDANSEVWDWRRSKGQDAIEAERQTWLADHPGQEWPEHECSLTDREYTDLLRWRREQTKQRRKPRQ